MKSPSGNTLMVGWRNRGYSAAIAGKPRLDRGQVPEKYWGPYCNAYKRGLEQLERVRGGEE